MEGDASPGAAVTACSVPWEGAGGEGRTVPGERGEIDRAVTSGWEEEMGPSVE